MLKPSASIVVVLAFTSSVARATDDLIMCTSGDPEFLDDIIAWQEGSTLYLQRLDEDSHLVGAKLAVDINMPSLHDSLNGPELGRDLWTNRYVLTYQVQDRVTGDMKLASAKHRLACSSDPYKNTCWDTPYTGASPDWIRKTYTAPAHQDRFNAFATVDEPSGVHISYIREEDNTDLSFNPLLTFRGIDDPVSQETKVSETLGTPNTIGRWMNIEGQLMAATTLKQGSYDRVALVSRSGAVTMITNLNGNAVQPMMDRTPDGTYKMLYRYSTSAMLGGSDPRNMVIVLTCTPSGTRTCRVAIDWSTQASFDYHDTGDNPALNYLTSVEDVPASVDGEDGLYALFLEQTRSTSSPRRLEGSGT